MRWVSSADEARSRTAMVIMQKMIKLMVHAPGSVTAKRFQVITMAQIMSYLIKAIAAGKEATSDFRSLR